ncbi:MAG: hypothetical protein RMJ07_05730 [Nitrososphaerota archaeon]|nr:hypothetical protein [Nitrososphaerota archaeon]
MGVQSVRIAFLLLASLIFLAGYSSESFSGDFVFREKSVILRGDILAVYFKPVLSNLEVSCFPVEGEAAFDIRFITNYTDVMFGSATVVLVQPEAGAIYNISLSFTSDKPWEYLIGVYTTSLSFYYENYGRLVETYGYFVRLRPPYTLPAGNITINILLTAHAASPQPIGFSFRLPAPANFAIILTSYFILAYINSFVFLDTYFKNKRESVSSRRWILVGGVLLISVILAYWLLNALALTPQGGV